ncbi:unnamed protein product [Gongylonema pulchrum]|uniref:Uncharacterized protein n=1 Tax=Gongylonema pulchrum TaxID=637853 RepID=A0A3P6QE95_9BILA|nr:unnamed protein product [Gongylonema pulchrum]
MDIKVFDGVKGTFLRCASLCSNATFKEDNRDVKLSKREANGDASEVAILKYCEFTCGDVAAYRELYPKVCEIPFNSTSKFQVTAPDRWYLINQSRRRDTAALVRMVMLLIRFIGDALFSMEWSDRHLVRAFILGVDTQTSVGWVLHFGNEGSARANYCTMCNIPS